MNRTSEAVGTGADQIAVGCPFCRVMLSDGLTAEQADGEAREEVEVLDVAQMLLASVKGESATKARKAASNGAPAAAPAAAATSPRRPRPSPSRRRYPDRGDGHRDRRRGPGRQGLRRVVLFDVEEGATRRRRGRDRSAEADAEV